MMVCGTVTAIERGVARVRMPQLVAVGDRVRIGRGARMVAGCVSAFDAEGAVIVADDSLEGVTPGTRVECVRAGERGVRLGMGLLGRAMDGSEAVGPDLPRILPQDRVALHEAFRTGVRAIDELLTLARGARVGIFGAPGAGKSTLVATIVRRADADAIVVASVGERGREGERWLRGCNARTTIVCASGDCGPQRRIRAAEIAFAQAHALRRRGLHVLLLVDSLARYANALRERALANGEPVGRGGYPPSVFTHMARTLEVAGATRDGTITLVATVLDDGDARDPVSDAARSMLDGHIALSSRLAASGHFPAIDVVASASRTMDAVVLPEQRMRAHTARAGVGGLERKSDARELGIAIDEERWAHAVGLLESLRQPADGEE
jgi:type III secretion protein N (ATPase)